MKNQSSKVPCFGSDPAADIELMRKMYIRKMKRERVKSMAFHFSAYTATAVIVGLIFRKIQHLFHH